MLTPITRMYERYGTEKEESDVSAFYGLMFFGELITKVTVCCVLSGVIDDRDRNRYGLLRELVRADGIGGWANTLDLTLTGPSAQFLRDEFQDLKRELLERVVPGVWQYEAVALLHATLVALQIDVENLPSKTPLRQWFSWFALLRNKTRGHGATLAFECARAVPLLEKSINLLTTNLSAFHWEWAYLHRNLSGKYRISSLSAGHESFDYLRQIKTESLQDGVYAFQGAPIRIELLETDPDITDFFVPNGQFRNLDYEVISYITNQIKRVDGKQWLTPATPLPNSETHGLFSLDPQGNSFSNVPARPDDYIQRPLLETALENALNHVRHEIVTLGGPGGIGKTSLALSVIKTLQSNASARFDAIVWFSARDIDLLPSGPKSVRPHGLSLDDFAKEYADLLAPPERNSKGFKPQEFFATALSGAPIGPTLYIFDNFETVTNPAEVFSWIDTYIRAPNKVLITTRTRDFVGDFPIEVLGMTDIEATQLINSVSAKLGISSLLSKEYRQTLFDESSGHPYVIKIMLGEVSKQNSLTKPQRIIANQEQILQALFERTYSALSPAAQRVFLLLSTWRSVVPSLAIEAVVMRTADERVDVRGAIDELKRLSFIEEFASNEGEESFVFLPLAAQSFGLKKLNASSLKAVIEADSELLQEFGAIRKDGMNTGIKPRIFHLIKALAKRIASGKQDLQSLKPMLEFVSMRVPAAWIDVSRLYIEEGNSVGKEWAKDALRRFIESGDDSVSRVVVWRSLADLCRATGDLQGEMQALAELSDTPNISTEELSRLADKINHIFSTAKRDGKVPFQHSERIHLVGKLIKQLESRLAQLDSTDLSRVAWLYMHVGNEERAQSLAEKGLEMDLENEYCIKLFEKLARR
jgi:hypothetical protein